MTEKFFYKDSMIFDFTATVISCEKSENGYITVLDRTAFFPEGGGQTGDTGIIDNIQITDTREKNGEIYHYSDYPIAVGKCVNGSVDKNIRFRKMQNHSGEHIVSGIVNSCFGYANVGFHLGKDDMTMDYDGEMTADDIKKIEYLANKAVYSDIQIETFFPSADELKKINYRSKIDLSENVRIVKIGDIDCCACCAPHVKSTGAVGVIKITEYIRYKGGMRLHARCGFDALDVFSNYQNFVTAIANSLSSKRNEIVSAFEKTVKESEEKSRTISALNRKIVDMTVSTVKSGQTNICLFFDNADMNTIRDAANKTKSKTDGLSAVFSGSDENGYIYCIASNDGSLSDKIKLINSELDGKGGGKGDMISGNCKAPRTVIEKFFEKKIGE